MTMLRPGDCNPFWLCSENLVAQAQNGSGKTATFALCMLVKTDRTNPQPQSLCLCHTRELARQNMDVIRELGQCNAFSDGVRGHFLQPYHWSNSHYDVSHKSMVNILQSLMGPFGRKIHKDHNVAFSSPRRIL